MAKVEKKQRMFDFETFEVSQVPKGQNKRKFLIFKELWEPEDGIETVTKQAAEIQTLIFNKDQFPTAADAKKWAKDNDFKFSKVDETENSFRLRQRNPGDFSRLRSKKLTSGVTATVGPVKKEDKRQQEEIMEEMLEKILKADLKDEEQIDAKIDKFLPEEIKKEGHKSGQLKAALKGAMRLITSVKRELPDGGKKLTDQLAGLMGETRKEDLSDEMKEKVKKAQEVIDQADKIKKEAGNGKEGDVIPKETQAKLDELFESHAKIAKENETLATSNKSLTEQVTKEREMRVAKEFHEKAKSFGHVGEDAIELGKTLKEAFETMSKEGYERFEKTLKAANDKIEAGNIFSELGTSAGGSVVYDDKIKVAKEAELKANPKLTSEQAEDLALQKNPELYNEYLSDNPSQVGGR